MYKVVLESYVLIGGRHVLHFYCVEGFSYPIVVTTYVWVAYMLSNGTGGKDLHFDGGAAVWIWRKLSDSSQQSLLANKTDHLFGPFDHFDSRKMTFQGCVPYMHSTLDFFTSWLGKRSFYIQILKAI